MTRRAFCFLTTFYPPYNYGGDGIRHSAARPRSLPGGDTTSPSFTMSMRTTCCAALRRGP